MHYLLSLTDHSLPIIISILSLIQACTSHSSFPGHSLSFAIISISQNKNVILVMRNYLGEQLTRNPSSVFLEELFFSVIT